MLGEGLTGETLKNMKVAAFLNVKSRSQILMTSRENDL